MPPSAVAVNGFSRYPSGSAIPQPARPVGTAGETALTFLIDTPQMLLVGFGTAFFLFGHDPFSSPYGRRVTACALLLHVLIDLLLPILSYLRAPDWMWGYLVPDAASLPAWLPVWVFLLYNVPFAFAFLLGARLSARGWKWTVAAFALSLAALVAIVSISADRSLVVGTTAEFLAGTARPISGSELAPVYNVGGGIAAVAVVAVIAFLVRSFRAQERTRVIAS